MSFRTLLAAKLALLTLLAAIGPVTASTATDPEIRDGLGDAHALQIVWPGELEDARQQTEANLSAFDITAAYIAAESRDTFSIVIEVHDLSEPFEPDAAAPVDAAAVPYLHADYEARFRVGTIDYLARAAVDLGEGAIESNYTLHTLGDDGGYLGALKGSIDPAEDRITFLILKAQVGDPADGTPLSRFYVTSGNQGIVVDQAPDAKTDLATQKILEPQYGDTYTFGQYRPEPRAFTLTPQGPTSGEGNTGEAITFLAALENQAATDEEILLTTSSLASGWSVVLDSTLIQLSPGSNKLVTIEVTPGEGAGKVGILILHASSTKGDLTRETSFTVRHIQDGGGHDGDGTDDPATSDATQPPGPDQSLSADRPKTEDSPGLGALALVAVGLVGVAVLRRRR